MDYFHMWKWLRYPSVWNGWLESVSSFIKLWCNINWGYKTFQSFLIFEYIAFTLWSYIKHKLYTDIKRVKNIYIIWAQAYIELLYEGHWLDIYLFFHSYINYTWHITYQHNIIIFFIAQKFLVLENSTELRVMFSSIYIYNTEYYIQIGLSWTRVFNHLAFNHSF